MEFFAFVQATGMQYPIEASTEASFAELKRVIAEETGVGDAENVALLHNGVPVGRDGGEAVAASALQSGDTLEVIESNVRALRLITEDHVALAGLPAHQREDKDIVLAAITAHPMDYLDISDSLRSDPNLALIALENDLPIQAINTSLWDDKAFVLAAIEQNATHLRYASPALLKDASVVLEAVKVDSATLFFADASLRGNAEVMLAALQESCGTKDSESEEEEEDSSWDVSDRFGYSEMSDYFASSAVMMLVSPELLENAEFLHKAVTFAPYLIHRTSDAMRNDSTIMQALLETAPELYPMTPPALLQDDVFMKALALRHSSAYSRCSRTLRSDPEFLKEIICRVEDMSHGSTQKMEIVLQAADPSVFRDKEAFLKATRCTFGLRLALPHLEEELFRDEEFVTELVEQLHHRDIVPLFPSFVLANHSFLGNLIEEYGIFDYLPVALREDEGLAFLAVSEDGARPMLGPTLRADRGFALRAVAVNSEALCLFVPVVREDPVVLAAAVVNFPGAVLHASGRALEDRGLMLHIAVISEGRTLPYLSSELQKDPNFLADVAQADTKYLKHLTLSKLLKQQIKQLCGVVTPAAKKAAPRRRVRS